MGCNEIISQSSTKKFAKETLIDDTARINSNANIDKKYKSMIKSRILNFETDIIWFTVLIIFLLHAIGIYSLLTFNYLENPLTTLWTFGMYIIANIGVSGGAHRLWSHNSYKAKLSMRVLLLICFSISGQNTIYSWVRNHRLHHKYCDTNADPHNTKRGLFYTHIGWVMMKEHPELIEKSKKLDLSDVLSDSVVMFDKKYHMLLLLLFGFILPTAVPVYLWNETWERAIISQVFIRYMITLNSVWTINSIAHRWGTRPYNKNIGPANNNFVNFLTIGEGYHNFHHMFPWDYRSSEKGNNKFNYTTFFIDFCAKLGQAYDLKYPSINLIKNVILNKGDGTHSSHCPKYQD
ncbi:acyl-CoA Delta(11) desaturase-like [Monomorium pharaonis]|uniref:acyl-CoA Delta(11) desaturase-like n=1 Tax=Monomorium pharaonis TaxID=307658 RepID=UPI001745DF8E|nr:acyl-CoA Delta(11) desaturase-like [Monomorium pharaonis]XP_036151124.1 acyl-CoA Delta(11) desaturase-like [Monomorium pharaonis]